MDQFDQLKLKYQSVLNLIATKGVRMQNLHVADGKLYMKGSAGTEDIKNEVWNQVKLVDGNWAADLICDIGVDPSLAPPPPAQRTYTVVKGDSLWKIAAHFYGNGAQYPKIIAANPDRLKDDKSIIHPGDVLVIPE